MRTLLCQKLQSVAGVSMRPSYVYSVYTAAGRIFFVISRFPISYLGTSPLLSEAYFSNPQKNILRF